MRYCIPPPPQHFYSPPTPDPPLQPPCQLWGTPEELRVAGDSGGHTVPGMTQVTVSHRCQGATGDRITWRWSGRGAVTLSYRI